jgi:hypothetical protein
MLKLNGTIIKRVGKGKKFRYKFDTGLKKNKEMDI